MNGIVIVGAGHAGGRTALLLREKGWNGPVMLVGTEPVVPYERPPLSKALLLGEDFGGTLATPETYARIGVEWLGGRTAVSLDRPSRQLRLDDGRPVPYDRLLIATGGRARRLRIPGADLDGVVELRTLADAQALAGRLAQARRLVVIGGGFIGLEVAASARLRACEVCLLSGANQVLMRSVPSRIAERIASLHMQRGVDLRLGVKPLRIDRGAGNTLVVTTTENARVPADVVVVGIGIEPNTALAEQAGLNCSDGVIVDSELRTNDPAIYAAGDVAAVWGPDKRGRRLESWHNAEDHAQAAATNLMAGKALVCDSPWFWSDHYDHSIQSVGSPSGAATTVTRMLADEALIDFHLDRDGRVVGASGFGPTGPLSKEFMRARTLVERRAAPAAADLANPSVKLKSLL